MPLSRKPAVPDAERTPQARLSEGAAHGIVGYQLAQAAIVTDQIFDLRVGSGGLRRVEFTILALIESNLDVTARQLARALAVTPPNIAIWLDRMASAGLVARTRSPTDARVLHLRLTDAGTSLVRFASAQLLEGERQALDGLSDAERAMLVELLHKVALGRKRVDTAG